jgi:hypothetical protein
MNRFALVASSGLAVSIIASGAHAALLGPGGTLVPVPLVAPAGVGFTLLANGTTPVTAATFSGTLSWGVWTNDVNNPFGLTALNFGYSFTNDTTSPNAVGRITINGFGSSTTDVGRSTFSGTVQPSIADRDTSIFGIIGFTYASFLNGMIQPGQTSQEMYIRTDATTWTFGDAAIIDGSIANVPVPAVIPTPGAAALAGLGLLTAARRRRA